VGERCRALWAEVKHPEHKQFSVAEMLEHERLQMMPVPVAFDGYVRRPSRAVAANAPSAAARDRR
jgi:hypothetical protein